MLFESVDFIDSLYLETHWQSHLALFAPLTFLSLPNLTANVLGDELTTQYFFMRRDNKLAALLLLLNEHIAKDKQTVIFW